MSIGIYKIENNLNHKIYIGQSTNIERRWKEHCRKSKKSLISQAIQKYGVENFTFQIIIQTENLSELNNLETFYIKKFNSLTPNGYNIIYVDDQEHHQFNKYSYDTFQNIIKDLKNESLTFQEIANKYDLDLSMVYYLNRGDYHILPNETYPIREVKDMSKKHYYCIDCGVEITRGALRCIKCDHLRQRKVDRPSREELKELIRTIPFTHIAEQFNVSDKAIVKWCISENLPSKKSEIKKYTDKEWELI